jgi:hypothetical protein
VHSFFDIAYRLVAIALGVASGRQLWLGLAERKIRSFNPDLLDWSRQVFDRDAAPVRYWLEIGIQAMLMITCGIAGVIGWWQPTN